MISYGQNNEDVLLARALADTESGFYIDVGAYDPTDSSVTRHFYDRGWHGINIEPQPAYAAKLRDARPRDVTLEVALSDRKGTATLYDVSIGDGVATIDAEQARRFGDRFRIVGETQVSVTTLAQVCATYCDAAAGISFLKVDVEGHEREVLAGADWSRWQPRVVLVEATEPLTTQPSHEPWEPILLEAGYCFALFDGLNRWYARRDEPRVLELLGTPVSVLDGYVPYAWSTRVAALEAELASLLAARTEGDGEGTERQLALIRSLESLQTRYHELSEALLRERSLRIMEGEELAHVRDAMDVLGQRTDH